MRVFRDQMVCEGNLFDQYDAIEDFCRKHMFLSGTMDQKERIDTLTVPYKVIREAALNILIHRTWWSSGNVLSVAIFDLCKENGLPKPEFELANGYVYLTIRFKHSLTPYLSGGVNDGVNDGVNSEADMLGESLKQVYNLIQGNLYDRGPCSLSQYFYNAMDRKHAMSALPGLFAETSKM